MDCFKVIGYYICELCDSPEWLQGISRQILSVSGCIGEQHPRWECFMGGWGKKAIQEYQEKLRLNKEQYIKFSETAKRLFDAGSLDVDSRFLRFPDARDFYERFCRAVSCCVISVSTTREYYEILAGERKSGNSHGRMFDDQCFPILARISRLNMLALMRGRQITGHGLELLKDLPLKDLFLQRTALDNEGLAQAAQIKKLENIYIAACHHITFEGLLAVSWRDKLYISDTDKHDDEGLAGLFTKAERKSYEDARTYKTMKNRISLDNPELQAPIHALWEFFNDMNRWEQMAEQKGRGDQAEIDASD